MIEQIMASGRFTVSYIQQGTNIYFKAKDAASMLGYVNTVKSTSNHVDEEFKVKRSDIYARGGTDLGMLELSACDSNIFNRARTMTAHT